MDIIKYFHEEPVHLEALSAETDPDARRRSEPALGLDDLLRPRAYYRGYLAGSHLAEDTVVRTGLTAIAQPEAFAVPLASVFDNLLWHAAWRDGTVADVGYAPDVFKAPGNVSALAGSMSVLGAMLRGDLVAVGSEERRYAIPSLRRLLTAAEVVAFPEPAHDGWDWSLFAAHPLCDRLVASLGEHASPEVRCFVLPYRQARSEHKFYFERWALGDLPDWVEEIR